MEFKVRLFLDGKQVEPSEVMIKSVTIDRIVNDCYNNRMIPEEPESQRKTKKREALAR